MAYYFTFLRHGESAGNAGGYVQGQSEFPLTDLGRTQAEALGAYWQAAGVRFDRIFASPLARALETARLIATALSQTVETDALWMERGFGAWEGLSIDEIFRRHPNASLTHAFHPVGERGESALDLYLRAGTAVKHLLALPEGRYLVVSHGAMLNLTMYVILGLSPLHYATGPRFHFENTTFVECSYDPVQSQWRLFSFNARPHLR